MKMMLTFRIIFSDLLKSKSRAENNLKNKIKRRVLILLFDSSAFKSIKSMILTLLDVFLPIRNRRRLKSESSFNSQSLTASRS